MILLSMTTSTITPTSSSCTFRHLSSPPPFVTAIRAFITTLIITLTTALITALTTTALITTLIITLF